MAISKERMDRFTDGDFYVVENGKRIKMSDYAKLKINEAKKNTPAKSTGRKSSKKSK